jgi:hypothetical protein
MTTAHVEKFAELVAKDPALLAKLGLDKVNADAAAAAASAAAFLTNAVKEAKAHGLNFTAEEFHAFMDAEAKAAASGELSDTQLEGVAGGYTAYASLTPGHDAPALAYSWAANGGAKSYSNLTDEIKRDAETGWLQNRRPRR